MRAARALALLAAFGAAGQGVLPEAVAAQQSPTGMYVYEVNAAARWMHGRQQPRFTRFEEHATWVHVDSIASDATDAVRTLHLSLGQGNRRDPALVRFGARGDVREVRVTLEPPASLAADRPGAAAGWVRGRLFAPSSTTEHLALPELTVHALVPTSPATDPRVGTRWTDTVDVQFDRVGFRQSMAGTRSSEIVGDTIVDGRRLWVVHDSARIRYAESWMRTERTLDTLVTVTREADGTIRGRHLYDPALGLYRLRHDTTVLAGHAVLHYPDGRVFRTPARYERTRRIDLHEPAAYAERRAALRAAFEARSTGMVTLPVSPLEERLAARDTLLRDSLLRVVEATADTRERAQIVAALRRWAAWDTAGAAQIRRVLQEDADTARLIRDLRRALYTAEPFDEGTVRRALPFLADPGLVFAFGERSDPLYENPRQALLLSTPAVTPDTADWPCTPAACRLLAARAASADGDSRLRALGLIAAFALDPARHAAEVQRRAEAGDPMLAPAAAMARGEIVHWPRTGETKPLPGPDAGWRDWVAWLDPTPAWYMPRPGARPQPLRVDDHVVATLRVHEIVTGRDFARELREKRDAAAADSARLVYDLILLELGGERADPGVVAERLRSGSEAGRTLALRELSRLFADAQPWVSDSADALLDRLLAVLIEGAAPWPELVPGQVRYRLGAVGPAEHRTETSAPVFLLSDSLPAAVAEAWRDRAEVISEDQWARRPARQGGILFRASPVWRAGPFVRLGASYLIRHERPPGQPPEGYAGGVTVTLLRTPTGWAIVALGAWIT